MNGFDWQADYLANIGVSYWEVSSLSEMAPEVCLSKSADLWGSSGRAVNLMYCWMAAYGRVIDDAAMADEVFRFTPFQAVVFGVSIIKNGLDLPLTLSEARSAAARGEIVIPRTFDFHCKHGVLPCDPVAKAKFGVEITELADEMLPKIHSSDLVATRNPVMRERLAKLGIEFVPPRRKLLKVGY